MTRRENSPGSGLGKTEFWNPEQNYRRALDLALDILEGNRKKVKFGPQYNILTSQGQQLEMDIFFFDSGDDMKNYAKRNYLILAKDHSGKTLGFRNQTVVSQKDSRGSGLSKTEGFIITRVRGKGIATAIERVNTDLLQRETNRLRHLGLLSDQGLAWQIHDTNWYNFEEFKSTHNAADLAVKKETERREEERKRWLALYDGNKGKLGFNEKGTKFFYPNSLNFDLELLKKVSLSKEGQVTEEMTIEDAGEIEPIIEQRQRNIDEIIRQIREFRPKS